MKKPKLSKKERRAADLKDRATEQRAKGRAAKATQRLRRPAQQAKHPLPLPMPRKSL